MGRRKKNANYHTEVVLTKLFIGIDLGTSAVKLSLVDEKGAILKEVSREYPLFFPQPGWSEQEPADWWRACFFGMKELLVGVDASAVEGIGCGGQMHGLVVPARSSGTTGAPRRRLTISTMRSARASSQR